MKKCVVKGCESSDSASSVSFHPFPENPHYRLLWLSRIKDCKFNKHSVVCGLHFKAEDYDAHNQLRYDAIPHNTGCSDSTQSHNQKPFIVTSENNFENNQPLIEVSPSTLNETTDVKGERLKEVIKNEVNPDESTDLKVCRACLAVDCKMFPLKNKKLKHAYNQVTGLRASPKDALPQLLCWECSSRVLSAFKFRERAKTAQDILAVLKCRHGSLNMGVIRSVNRQRQKLTSQLAHEYDVHIDGKETTDSDNVDNNAERHTEDSKEAIKEFIDDSLMDHSGLDDCHENYEVASVKSEDEIDQPVKVKVSDEIIMVNDENRIDDDKSLSSDDDVDDVIQKHIINSNTLKKVKKVRSRKPTVRKLPSKRRSPSVYLAKFFTITSVSLADAIAAAQEREHSPSYTLAPYKCEICYRGYSIKAHYETHVLKHTERFGEHECEVCKIRCRSERRLTEHRLLHLRIFSCLRCDHVTCTRAMATEHIRYHDGAVYQCPHCPRHFQKKTTYYSHLRLKHACEFVCDLCGHTFLNKLGMESHRRRRHVLDNTTPLTGPHCAACDVTFASHAAHDTHLTMSSKHNQDKDRDIVNAYCSTSKSTGDGRRRHFAATLKPVTCEQCGVTLDNVYAYGHHFRKKHPTATRTQHRPRTATVVCEICGKTIHNPAAMKSHIAEHKGQRFQCDHCGKNFKNRKNLINHLRLHQPSRPRYPCEKCGKLFTHISNMKRHLKTHTEPAPYECDICGKRLTTFAGVRDHIEHVHNGRPWPKRTRHRATDNTRP